MLKPNREPKPETPQPLNPSPQRPLGPSPDAPVSGSSRPVSLLRGAGPALAVALGDLGGLGSGSEVRVFWVQLLLLLLLLLLPFFHSLLAKGRFIGALRV